MTLATEEKQLVKGFIDYCSQYSWGGYVVISDLKAICNDKMISPLGYINLENMIFTPIWNDMMRRLAVSQRESLTAIVQRAIEEFAEYGISLNNQSVYQSVVMPEVNF